MDLDERHHRFRRPWAYDEVCALFESRGCLLLEPQYTGYKQSLRYRCAGGHEYTQRFDHFVSGHGCPTCRNERRWNGRRTDLGDILIAVEDEGLIDVDVERKHGRISVSYTCPNAHRAKTSSHHFFAGKRCRLCLLDILRARRGPANPRFNHDLTDEDRATKRKYEEYAAWRSGVFARDGYACRRCGARGRLNAHHVINYSSARELRTETANGCTLCVECHRGFHGAHGYSRNDANQLNAFTGGTWV